MTPRVRVPEPIGVLCGGPSAEREISLRSGHAVWTALRGLGYPVRLVDILRPEWVDQLCAERIRTAFVALHGPFGEDGTVQALLESLEIVYTGSGVAASRLAMDKASARLQLAASGVPVPRGFVVPSHCEAPDGFWWPVVVKPSRQGSSIGLTIVEHPAGWRAAVAEARRYDEVVLCEEYLRGQEIAVGIVDDAPLPVIQVVPSRRFYDYVAKYTPGITQYLVPAPLNAATTSAVQAMALRAHRALGCRGFSRADLIVTPDRGGVVLEVNTIPGLTATSLLPKAAAATGVSFPQLCERLLASAESHHRVRESVLSAVQPEEV